MKKSVMLVGLSCVAVMGLLATPVQGKKAARKAVVIPVLDAAEAEDLLFMREEEKLAHDVYTALYEIWNQQVFINIAASEQRHTDSILRLLSTYGLADPVLGAGEFSNPELQELYDALLKRGSTSLLDALYVGALIEEVDMDDIVAAMDRTDESAIEKVYANLLSGSESHLQAFVSNIEYLTGETYEAQYLPN
ncbi:MAG: DUF2202 domain-containing protein [Pontiellaceae bacterium]|nr:DUF2202 domain-containing protein [Pontiellaceae bacterium]MBN2783770.1 DUF2202 domain-containing protein [Pontiellaceae bacterium]